MCTDGSIGSVNKAELGMPRVLVFPVRRCDTTLATEADALTAGLKVQMS